VHRSESRPILGGIHLPAAGGALLALTHVIQVSLILSEVHWVSVPGNASKFRIFRQNRTKPAFNARNSETPKTAKQHVSILPTGHNNYTYYI
jgi:hypothetical protein